MPRRAAYSLGLDFGTNSVRALIVDVRDGREIAAAIAGYPSGEAGILLDKRDPNVARQSPADYHSAMPRCVKAALRAAARVRGFAPERIIGIGVDTTASTPIPVDAQCTPLGLKPAFRRNLDAQAWLWKDHTAHEEADQITKLLRRTDPRRIGRCGGVYSSEWLWSKALHCLRVAPRVFNAAASWVEQCDYIPALLTGVTEVSAVKRGVCAAGHKAMYLPDRGLPRAEHLRRLDRGLADLRAGMYDTAHTSDQSAGGLCKAWARRLGLSAGTPVAVGSIDAHSGAVGSGIKPGTLVKILGTSACDMLVGPAGKRIGDIPGLCGVVDGSIVPGHAGIEAGQPAVGDIFNWFVTQFDSRHDGHERLTAGASRLKPGETGLIALDWNNGNRSVLVDVRLTGLLVGQTLHTTPAEVYRALLEATAFGARVIMERIEAHGVRVRQVVNCGGIAEKNPLLMQIYADVTGRPMKLSRSAETCALGAAIFGTVAAGRKRGGYRSVPAAQRAMCGLNKTIYKPRPAARMIYNALFEIYRSLHDSFGGVSREVRVDRVMKDLIALRERARSA